MVQDFINNPIYKIQTKLACCRCDRLQAFLGREAAEKRGKCIVEGIKAS
jgi:hypothetical protein